MKIRLHPKSVRMQLTLWYELVLAAVLLVFIAGSSVMLFLQMQNQLKHLAVEDLETVEGLLYFSDDGRLHFRDDYHNHPQSKLIEERFLEVLAPDGTILFQNDRLGSRTVGGAPFSGEGEGGYSERIEHLSDGSSVVLVSRQHILQGRPILIRVAYSEDSIWTQVKETLAILLAALPLTLLVAAFASIKMASRALAPVETMAQQAEQINAERLDKRLPVEDNEDELGHLARVFNDTLARIEQSFEQLKRFTSDASHELRTPLAAIRSIGEVGLETDTSLEECRDTIGSMLEEVNRLTSLVESLLTLSRADAGQISMHETEFPALQLVREAASLLDVLIKEKKLTYTLVGDESALVRGDRIFLEQAVINILHNAVKFTPPGGTISAYVSHETGTEVILAITDSGPGISADHSAKIFDRFYRVDPARARENKGVGLGLSIARWVVQAHKGQIDLTAASTGGCTFSIRLPAA